ncbi:MAG: hypothetical protein R3B06_03035 [Kofleriaceae bacterium]
MFKVDGNRGLMVVTKVALDASRNEVRASLLLGVRLRDIVLGFSSSPGAQLISIPNELSIHRGGFMAVLDVLTKCYEEQSVTTPQDMSSFVRESFEPWPTRVVIGKDGVQSLGHILVEEFRLALGVYLLRFAIGGVPSLVVVDDRDDGLLYFRFLSGVHPWHLEDTEASALVGRLVAAIGRDVKQVLEDELRGADILIEGGFDVSEVLASLPPTSFGPD